MKRSDNFHDYEPEHEGEDDDVLADLYESLEEDERSKEGEEFTDAEWKLIEREAQKYTEEEKLKGNER